MKVGSAYSDLAVGAATYVAAREHLRTHVPTRRTVAVRQGASWNCT